MKAAEIRGPQDLVQRIFRIGKKIELALEDLIKDQIITVETNIQVVRNSRYSNRMDGFIGGRYAGVRPGDEERLFQFIHDAQSYEIRTRLKN